MKITFVQGAYENLGVEYLSAVLKREGHRVRLAYHHKLFNDAVLEVPFLAKFFAHGAQFVQDILSDDPDLICFSVVTDDWLWAKRFAQEIKQCRPNILIAFGGIHATSVPQDVMAEPAIDFACRGEGEEALVELCDHLERGHDPTNIRNIWARCGYGVVSNPVRPLIANLDTIPFPDKEIFYSVAPYFRGSYTAMGTRGCTLSCPYCHHNVQKKLYSSEKGYFRKHSVERVISELEQAVALWGSRQVMFEDDMFLQDKQWAEQFCHEFKRRVGIPWMCIGHPLQIDADRARWLAESGCQYIELGVQTFNESVKQIILKRPENNRDVIRSFMLLHKYGVAYNCDQLAGLPGETEDDLIYAVHIYNRHRPNRIFYLFLTYYPKTDIADIVTKMGHASSEEVELVRLGRGQSFTQRGSVTSDIFFQFRFLFGFLPLLPRSWVAWLIDKCRYRYLPRSTPLCTNLPDSLGTLLFGIKDFRGRTVMGRYIRHILRLGY